MKNILSFIGLFLLATALTVGAQEAGQGRGPGGQGRGMGPGPGPGFGRSQMTLVFDLNKDGVLDSNEIAQASASLKKLDKDGDGKITAEEMRPQRPGGTNQVDRPRTR